MREVEGIEEAWVRHTVARIWLGCNCGLLSDHLCFVVS